MMRKRLSTMHPTKILVYGFLLLIIIGSILLTLPIATVNGRGADYIDALFTATSAVCVTGLAVHETAAYWSSFGKSVILLLIQVGGLGIMTTVTLGIFLTGKRISLYNRMVLKESLNESRIAGVVKMTRRILIFTFCIEFIGAVILSFGFIPEYGFSKGILYSIFHSVSAFCNAGFDIVGPNSMAPFAFNPFITFTLMALIIVGGLGFHVINSLLMRSQGYRVGTHTKFVLLITLILIVGGTILFFLLETNNWSDYSLLERVQLSAFQSVTTRTAGFSTYNQAAMSDSSKIISEILMFIGGSPGSTAGGVKTTTIGIIFVSVISLILGKNDNEVFRRRIQTELVRKALALFFMALTLVLLAVILLTITDSSLGVGHLLFETISAFGTVGLSTGITPFLSTIGKCIIIVMMYFGRVGPVTILVAVSSNAEDMNIIRYPQGRIYIG